MLRLYGVHLHLTTHFSSQWQFMCPCCSSRRASHLGDRPQLALRVIPVTTPDRRDWLLCRKPELCFLELCLFLVIWELANWLLHESIQCVHFRDEVLIDHFAISGLIQKNKICSHISICHNHFPLSDGWAWAQLVAFFSEQPCPF